MPADSSGVAKPPPLLPPPFERAKRVQVATLADVPSADALRDFLLSRGVPTDKWGQGNTKDVSKYWKEIKLDEAGLEIWEKPDGSVQTVRVTHVLRAKVCSQSSYEKGCFLFNSWQQYGDGRKRTRNGLLSEKLSISELPLEDHLLDVCRRAVTEEEMQRVEPASLKIVPGCPAPVYDLNYKCPLSVDAVNFVDHTIEVEESKSYPGLVTMYHLYTVDVVCSGLPSTDFNTLEFEHADQNGTRKLKYVHAWVWLGWQQIQRYLFDGSVLKERRVKDSFENEDSLEMWLQQFDLDLEDWGVGTHRSTADLFAELQHEKAQLELWGRQDGVPLLMRVVHVLNLKVISTDPSLAGKLLFNTWSQSSDGSVKSENRLLSAKLSTADLPFNDSVFAASAERAVKDRLSIIVDQFFSLDPTSPPKVGSIPSSDVKVNRVNFIDHRCDLEDSPSYVGLHTMYHLYTIEVECEGLPPTGFSSLDFTLPKNVMSKRWTWCTWQETLDVMHSTLNAVEAKRVAGDRELTEAKQCAIEIKRCLCSNRPHDHERAEELIDRLCDTLSSIREDFRESPTALSSTIPPSLVSMLSEKKHVSDEMVGSALKRMQSMQSQ
jgi:hypothetical protein